jgi:glutamate dehydrogenase
MRRRSESSDTDVADDSANLVLLHRFDAIWREHGKTGKPRSVISTEMSQKLNELSEELEKTELYNQKRLRNAVMAQVFPQTLIKKIGLEQLIERIPEAYARSAFAAVVAASFVYLNGPGASHVAFYEHLLKLSAPAEGK